MSFVEKQIEPIAAIILAAGGSRRFGKPKQLLIWKDDNFINTVIEIAMKARLVPIVVVLGAEAPSITSTIRQKDLKIIINSDWEKGQSSSIRLGVQALLEENSNTMGAFFLQVDQPQTSNSLIELMKKEAKTGAQIVAPWFCDEVLSPVYFSKHCFGKLMQIEGDHGGKTIFPHFDVRTVEWQDERQTIDIDTPEDYEMLRELYGINGAHQV